MNVGTRMVNFLWCVLWWKTCIPRYAPMPPPNPANASWTLRKLVNQWKRILIDPSSL